MFIQIVVVIQDIARSLDVRITPCTPRLLHIVLQRIGNLIMHHQAHILLIHAHTKSGGGHDTSHLIIDKGILVTDFIVRIHLPMIRQGRKTVVGQFLRQIARFLCTGDIDNRRATVFLQQPSKLAILIILRIGMDHAIFQVFTLGLRSKFLQVQIQRPLEIVTDIRNDLLLCRRRKTRDGNLICPTLHFLQALDKFADIEIIHPEILSPSGETMGFINHKSHHIPREEQPLHRFGTKHLRRDIKYRCRTILHTSNGIGTGNRIQQSIDGDGIRNSPLHKIIHLVFHQRLQRRDDHRQPMHSPTSQNGRQLESQRLAATRREYRQQGVAVYSFLDSPLLQGFAIKSTDLRITKNLLQACIDVQFAFAITAPLLTRRITQIIYRALYFRIIAQQPRRRKGSKIIRSDQRQRISQLHWVFFHERGDTLMDT